MAKAQKEGIKHKHMTGNARARTQSMLEAQSSSGTELGLANRPLTCPCISLMKGRFAFLKAIKTKQEKDMRDCM